MLQIGLFHRRVSKYPLPRFFVWGGCINQVHSLQWLPPSSGTGFPGRPHIPPRRQVFGERTNAQVPHRVLRQVQQFEARWQLWGQPRLSTHGPLALGLRAGPRDPKAWTCSKHVLSFPQASNLDQMWASFRGSLLSFPKTPQGRTT